MLTLWRLQSFNLSQETNGSEVTLVSRHHNNFRQFVFQIPLQHQGNIFEHSPTIEIRDGTTVINQVNNLRVSKFIYVSRF